jgi:creatinine amidohydrolase
MNPQPFAPLLPTRINTGPWLAGYSLNELKVRLRTDRVVLPICSLGTPPEELAQLAPLVLPPLYHEALAAEGADLKSAIAAQIRRCFPFYEGTRERDRFRGSFELVEVPARRCAPPASRPRVLAFSIDTAVEQHGPHLPLATDTLESYAVLDALATEFDGVVVGPPVDYGHLTWGLPFGLSIDLTPPLVTRYVRGFVNAIVDWMSPAAVHVVDVHGSLMHRNAIQEGLRGSSCERWAFSWLFEPLAEFAADRGDQHAGGVETALVERISRELLDARWWPGRIEELASGQMTVPRALELSGDMRGFVEEVESRNLNGIVGDIRNHAQVDASAMFERMLDLGRRDLQPLLR